MPVRIAICKARRAGLSTGVESLIYDDATTNKNTDSLIVAHQTSSSENVLEMCNRFWRETPEEIAFGDNYIIKARPQLVPAMQGKTSRNSLRFDAPLNSRIFIATARSIDAYLGYGFHNIHATEASRYDDGTELFRALYPTLSTDEHSALYVESTPNGQVGKGAWFHQYVMAAASRKKTEYGETRLVFIPWQNMRYSFFLPFTNDEKKWSFKASLKPAEKDLLRRYPEILLEQLNWRRMVLSGPPFSGDEELFDQEYPTDLATAFLMSGTSLFSRKTIKRLMQTVRTPIWKGDVYWGESDADNKMRAIHDVIRRPRLLSIGEAISGLRASHVNEGLLENLLVWRFPKKGDRLFISADVAEGDPETKDGDYSTIYVGCLNEGFGDDEILMRWKGHIDPLSFAEVLCALAWWCQYEVGDDVIAPEVIPEWTGPGRAVCNHIDHFNLYGNMYRYQRLDIHGQQKTKGLGWESNDKSKPLMVSYSKRMAERGTIDIPDEELVLEMSTYRRLDNYSDVESFGGAPGMHDDLVSAFQILCAVMRLRTDPVPMEETVFEKSDGMGGPDDVPWDPFRRDVPIVGLPGLTTGNFDEENLEETAFYSG